MIAEGDLVSVRGRARGVHKSPFRGIPPTGRSFDDPIYLTYRVAGGKIVDHWMLTDNAEMMQQLGVAPSPVETDQESRSMITITACCG
jgi:predicted ester cyclase